MSIKRTHIVGEASAILSKFVILAKLCDELKEIDDLDTALAEKKQEHGEAMAAIARLDELKTEIKTSEARLGRLNHEIKLLQNRAADISKK